MSKITLNTIGTLVDTTTAQTALNDNFQTIQTAFDDTLSRDGTQPNVMGATLDMNSNRIINLPAPGGVNDPVRLQDVTGSPTLNLSITLAGDVTSPTGNGTLTTTIASGAVTGSKIATGTVTSANIANGTVANVDLATSANNTIKSNVSGGTASPSDNTITQILDSTIGNTQGTIAYRGASAWVPLSPGTAGQILSTNGAGANPSWIANSGGGSTTLTPEQFGAVGNGSTDDTVALQNFLAACANGTGKFTSGKTYIVNGFLFVPNNCYLIGYGATIKAAVTAASNQSGLNITDTTQGTAQGPSNVTIVGLTMNGNATARRAGGAFSGVGNAGSFYAIATQNLHIRDCIAIDSEGDGFYVGGLSASSNASANFSFENCFATTSSRNGYSIVGATNGAFINCIAENISFGQGHSNISYGYDYEPDNSNTQNNAVNCISCQAINCSSVGFGVNNTNGPNTQITWSSCFTQLCGVGYYSSNATSSTTLRVVGCRLLSNTTNYNNCADAIASFP